VSAFVFQYPAVIVSWTDGDSCKVDRQTKPGETIKAEDVRVHGINAPEVKEAGGAAARDYAAGLAPTGTAVLLVASKEDKFGRFLARVILPNGDSLGDLMVAAGHAVPYLQ
jgi:endonuclease YncB( thermonuclease family)